MHISSRAAGCKRICIEEGFTDCGIEDCSVIEVRTMYDSSREDRASCMLRMSSAFKGKP